MTTYYTTFESHFINTNAAPSCQVENYLQAVLNCQRKTLGNTLKRSLNRYPNQARVEWLMDADPPGSVSKTDPAQVNKCYAGFEGDRRRFDKVYA